LTIIADARDAHCDSFFNEVSYMFEIIHTSFFFFWYAFINVIKPLWINHFHQSCKHILKLDKTHIEKHKLMRIFQCQEKFCCKGLCFIIHQNGCAIEKVFNNHWQQSNHILVQSIF